MAKDKTALSKKTLMTPKTAARIQSKTVKDIMLDKVSG